MNSRFLPPERVDPAIGARQEQPCGTRFRHFGLDRELRTVVPMIFSVFCPTHDSRVLLTRRNALSFWNAPDGPVVHWKCTCGTEGILTRHGSEAVSAEPEDAPHLERA